MPLYIDGRLVLSDKKYTILQLCSRINTHIPRFCYHPKLSIAANCRMCLVQLEGSVKPIAACAVSIQPNMVVYTKTFLVKKFRESVIELLLINHPLDCPICDQGGECDLQDQAMLYGSDRGRYLDKKRAVKDLSLGVVLKTFMTRCIHCTRCTRFLAEVAQYPAVGLIGRGSNVRVSLFDATNSKLSHPFIGNLSDICPVGALTIKPYSFLARPWELKHFNTIDVLDSFGSNLKVEVRGTEILRVLPNPTIGINEHWITDKARFWFDGLKYQRVFMPAIWQPAKPMVLFSWSQIFTVCKFVLSRVLAISCFKLKAFPRFKHQINAFFGPSVDFETFFFFKKILLLLPFGSNVRFCFTNNALFRQPGISTFKHFYSWRALLRDGFKNQMFSFLLVGFNGADVPLFLTDLQTNDLNKKPQIFVISSGYRNFGGALPAAEHTSVMRGNSSGLSTYTFVRLIKGQSPVLNSALTQNFRLIFGHGSLMRFDFHQLFLLLGYVAQSFPELGLSQKFYNTVLGQTSYLNFFETFGQNP
jgi:hypothetical protein